MTSLDLDEIAAQLRDHIITAAASFMPRPVLLIVKDASTLASNGWVLCDHEGRTVRALVPGNYAAVGTVLFAFPPNNPSEEYVAFGGYGEGSYLPGMSGPQMSFTQSSSAPTAPTSGHTLYSNGDGALMARTAGGNDFRVDDDTTAWLAFFGG